MSIFDAACKFNGTFQTRSDTIAAIATAPGQGGIGIVRASGAQVPRIAQKVLGGLPKPRRAAYQDFLDENGETLDQGLALYFPKPNSFTGEDVLELQGHGGPAVLDSVLRRVLQLGARLARPGEFSERAFLNGQIDLTQAEAIADLVAARTQQAARAAVRSLQGAFSRRVEAISDALITLRTFVEAAIDFSEESIECLQDQALTERLQTILQALCTLKCEARQGQVLQEGLHVVIAGPPNVGKSSLLNALSGFEAAIVTEIPGTTRDLVHATIQIEGLPVQLVDTAGLRETQDQVEQEGVRRAQAELHRADQILWLLDASAEDTSGGRMEFERFCSGEACFTLVRNKIDLSGEPAGLTEEEGSTVIRLSVKSGQGLDVLRAHLKKAAGLDGTSGTLSARRRHVEALICAEQELQSGLQHWQHHHALEILSVHLSAAHQRLGEITGAFTTEDLLSCIFSSFCIGK